MLSRVNSAINQKIEAQSDLEQYGQLEFWTLPGTSGDCEDYVLLKRRELVRLGFAESSLLITVVIDERGEGHAVLSIPTTSGDFILDNRRDEILLWTDVGYTFLKRQSAEDANRWVSLGSRGFQAANLASGSDER